MNRFYIKEVVTTAVYDRNGKAIPFIHIGGGYGHLTLDDQKDAQLIEDLEKYRAARKGGIVAATEAEVTKKKEKHPLRLSALPSKMLTVAPDRHRGLLPRKPVAVAAEVPVATAPPVVPITAPAPPANLEPVQPKGFKPRLGKAKKAAEPPTP